jgi:hypothetical protein
LPPSKIFTFFGTVITSFPFTAYNNTYNIRSQAAIFETAYCNLIRLWLLCTYPAKRKENDV